MHRCVAVCLTLKPHLHRPNLCTATQSPLLCVTLQVAFEKSESMALTPCLWSRAYLLLISTLHPEVHGRRTLLFPQGILQWHAGCPQPAIAAVSRCIIPQSNLQLRPLCM